VLAGIQANQERSYTGRGLVTAQHTAADYERVVEQGQLAVQAQLHFTYPQTQTVLDKSWSRLSMSPASRKQQPAEQLPGVCAEDEPTARKQSKARYAWMHQGSRDRMHYASCSAHQHRCSKRLSGAPWKQQVTVCPFHIILKIRALLHASTKLATVSIDQLCILLQYRAGTATQSRHTHLLMR